MGNLYECLKKYSKDGYYPMHMPGHKRNTNMISMENPYEIDITEIDGFDNLHDPMGILQEAMKKAAKVYHSNKSYFLINGSTAGILAGICACTKKGEQVLMARNCHKSVYNAIFLNELVPFYIYPQTDEHFSINCGISSEYIEEMMIIHPDIKLIIITSPTYEGIVSDVKEIARIAHEKGIPLMVDEAHGAHLGFHPNFPKNSIENHADIVIHSLHKTLPSFTQTGLMHVNGNLVNYDKIKMYLGIYQSSSPSYILMAGIDKCMDLLIKNGTELFENYNNNLVELYLKLKKLKNIRVFSMEDIENKSQEIYSWDRSKLVISVKGTTLTGAGLYDILLKKYKIQLELTSKDYVIAMTSICDTKEGFERLEEALFKIDETLEQKKSDNDYSSKLSELEKKLTVYEAFYRKSEIVEFVQSEGRIAKEYIFVYPPGIPLLVPGETISNELIEKIELFCNSGLMIKGLVNANKSIEVIYEL